MRRRRDRGRDALLGRWVCDGLVPMSLLHRLAREVARAADFDALHTALRRIEHAYIECRIDHDQIASLRQQHRRRFYALADAAIVRPTRVDPRSSRPEVDKDQVSAKSRAHVECAKEQRAATFFLTNIP